MWETCFRRKGTVVMSGFGCAFGSFSQVFRCCWGGEGAWLKSLNSRINVILFKNFFWSLDCMSARHQQSKKAQGLFQLDKGFRNKL